MSKYKSRKVITHDGIEFDSAKECRRYYELSLMEKAGEIHDLQRQVRFELIPAQREPDTITKRGRVIKGKVIEHSITYIADFVYFTKDGIRIVEDVKGYKKGTAYSVFTIKRKLMLWVHGIRIKEV